MHLYTPQDWNYLLEGGPLVGQASPTRFPPSVLGAHLYQCVSWSFCQRLHLASVNFF